MLVAIIKTKTLCFVLYFAQFALPLHRNLKNYGKKKVALQARRTAYGA